MALVVAGCFEPGFRGGGPVRSLVEIVDSLDDGIQAWLVTSDRDVGVSQPYPGLSGKWVQRGQTRVHYLDVGSLGAFWSLLRQARRHRFDVLYVNSLWSWRFSMVPVLMVRLGVLEAEVVLVAPRGELSPGATAIKPRKKAAFLRVWRPVLRSLGAWFHATSGLEVEHLRHNFPWARIIEVGNIVRLPDALRAPSSAPGALHLIYVGRVCRKKNLALVLEALTGATRPVKLDIYGPIESDGHWARCQEMMSRLPPCVSAMYLGEIEHVDVGSAIAKCDAFVLATAGENFGHVVLESLAHGCPVICSDQTPWTATLRDGGGVALESLDVEPWRAELNRWARLTEQERNDAKLAATLAYRRWLSEQRPVNVLNLIKDEVRQRVDDFEPPRTD